MFGSPLKFVSSPAYLRSPKMYKRRDTEPLISPLSSPYPFSAEFPPNFNPSRRRSSNPLVYVQSKSSRTAGLLLALVMLALYTTSFGKDRDWLSNWSISESHDYGFERFSSANAQYVAQGRRPIVGASAELLTTNAVPPLTPSQELFALILHLTSSNTNGLPPLDPDQPLNPDFVLDVALPTSPNERQEALKQLEEECWEAWPVVVLGRQGEVFMNEAVNLLKNEAYLGRKGQMGIVHLNRGPDSIILSSLLNRLTRQPTLPSILIGGHPIGTFVELKTLHDQGRLGSLLSHAGVIIGNDLREREAKEKQAAVIGRKAARI